METSDSECFESADEEFYSDDDDEQARKINKVVESKHSRISEKLASDLHLEDNVDLKPELENETVNIPKQLCGRDDENNVRETKINTSPLETDEESNKIIEKVDNLEIIGKTTKSVNAKETTEVLKITEPENNSKSQPIIHKPETPPIEEPKPELPPKKPKESKLGAKLANKPVNLKPHIAEPKAQIPSDPKPPPVQTPTEPKPEVVEDDQDNLWDDEEIDWGKEEALNTDTKPAKEENLWEDDDWEPIEAETKPNVSTQNTTEDNTWGSWGNWGVTTILNTATSSVSTITSQVSHGLSTVLESGIGVPDPEELARINKEEDVKIAQLQAEWQTSSENPPGQPNPTSFGLGNLGTFVSGVSQFTKLMETTGTKVISGGLDTLETIGKKTMQVLQEGDPGLKKKRAFLKLDHNKPVLSQVLRDAKEKSEQENKVREDKHFAKQSKNYETLFDDHQGLIHLEALEMLSKQCDIKLETLSENAMGEELADLQETLEQVKELCELPDEDEDEQVTFTEIKEKIEGAIRDINIKITYDHLITSYEETEQWLSSLNLHLLDERELHQQAIESLAQLTAIAVEQFHKAAELLLVQDHRSTADEADSLVQLTTTLTALIGIVAAKFSEKLNAKASSSQNKDGINGLITNVFLEAANSSTYIQDAFHLLIPVLQVGAV